MGDDFELDDALESWRWLVPRPVAFLLLTAVGDLFLEEADGTVWFMDSVEGQYYKVAETNAQWSAMLSDPGRIEAWFMPAFVAELVEAGKSLAESECFTATQWPILGGSFAVTNWEPTHWRVHFWSLGQVHQQVKDLPEGEVITSVKFTPL